MKFVAMPVQGCANQPNPQRRKKRNRNRKRGPGGGPATDVYAQYKIALRDPFSASAEGVRLPDSFRYPTTAVKFKQRVTLTSTAAGEMGFTMLPNPLFCMQILAGAQSGFQTMGSNVKCCRMLSRGDMLVARYGQYRVVAWGFRLLMSDTAFAAKGIYTVAPVPIPQNSFLDPDQMAQITMGVAPPTDYLGMPRPDSTTELLPHARTFNAQDLMNKGDFLAVGVPYDPSCKDFRPVPDDSNTAFGSLPLYAGVAAGSAFVTALGLPSTIANAGTVNTLDMAGNIGFLIYGTGLPPSTNELSLEVVYHVEVVLNPTAGNIAASVGSPPPVGSTSILENIYTGVKDVFYFDKEMLETTGRLGMKGLQFATSQYNRRNKVRALM